MTVLRTMTDESIDMCMTSPPYWGLRDYDVSQIFGGDLDCEHEWGGSFKHDVREEINHAKSRTTDRFYGEPSRKFDGNHQKHESNIYCLKCHAWKGQLGLEPTPELYIEHMTKIFHEVKRVLKKEGTLWLNIGDTYSGSGKGSGDDKPDPKFKGGGRERTLRPDKNNPFPAKCLCMIPERLAWSLIQDESGDIYELDKGYVICNNINITEEATSATQRPRKEKKISSRVCKEMEGGAPEALSRKNGKMERKEQGESEDIQQETLLDSSGAGNSKGNEGQCKKISQASTKGIDTLWRKSTDMCMLWGKQDSFFINRSHRRKGQRTQKEDKKIWLNLRVVKSHELSQGFQDFMQKLQLGNGSIWFLPPSRGRNLCFRKKDIPIDLLPLFKLKQEERWRLRNKIIWYKPNGMPSSVKDRFSNKYEFIYMFSKQQKYYFDLDSIREDYSLGTILRINQNDGNPIWSGDHKRGSPHGEHTLNPDQFINPKGKNPGDVFILGTMPFPEAHFAVFPEKLCEKPIKAGCPLQVCSKCGKARERIVEEKRGDAMDSLSISKESGNPRKGGSIYHPIIESKTTGWTSCSCNVEFVPGIVLDSFMGAGTTGVVARKLGRSFVGIDVKEEYCEMSKRRIAKVGYQPELFE